MSNARNAIVVAHPDDECLWLSSALASADRVVFCFGDLFERPKKSLSRQRAVAALPLAGHVDLRLRESGAGFSVDWTNPLLTDSGIAISDAAARQRYDANYPRLVDALRPALAGYTDIYTHNPWGEYGHAEHIQVYRAVAALQVELGYTIRFSNYVGPLSWGLAERLCRQPFWSQCIAVQPDPVTARRLMRVYQRHGAWTWTRFHRWPGEEAIYAQPPAGSGEASRPVSGEWLLDVSRLRWLLPWRRARRCLELSSGRDE